MNVKELHRRIVAYIEYKGIDPNKINASAVVRGVKRELAFRENYLELKEKYNENTLHLFMTNMLRSYIEDKDIDSTKKIEIIRELLKHV